MDLAAFRPTSEEITAAFLIAIAAFFLYMQLKRIGRLASRDEREVNDGDRQEEDEEK